MTFEQYWENKGARTYVDLTDHKERARLAWEAAFVEGAKWWEFKSSGATMWQSDQKETLEEASK